ncbi:E3 ubiquitin-protein ligase RNF169 [Heterodontus francisci]|uniref:E3 ubiquitin-protein ligase RNF169 n=1 Tax=Heterodontus francisci TaxID=7792 RepID=UPI00355BCB70
MGQKASYCIIRANDNMSDSENEEPVKRMPTRQWGSATNSKLRSNSSGRMTSMLLANTEENRSGSTPVENNQNRKVTPRSDSRTKTASVSSNSLSTNILASSENSRSNSAPTLSSEKRTLSDPALSCSVKRERSVSPDSNDSISGELNHFKPIICSPCTPPKKLPDGRLLKPKIVKSTPRNLQKPNTTTTYDVNPNILEKWGQILQDRQEEKTASKGTLTSEEEEEEEEEVSELALAKASCSPGPGGIGCSGPWSAPRPVDYSDSTEVPESSLEVSVEWETSESSKEPRSVLHEDTEQENGPHRNSKNLFPSHAAKKRSKGHVTTGSSTASGSGSKGAPSHLHRKRKQQHKSNYTAAYRSKRAKWNAKGNTSTANQSLTSLHQTQQEEEDRKLAFRLQRQFDVERTTVNRQKGSEDGYPLRTKANTRTKKRDWDH